MKTSKPSAPAAPKSTAASSKPASQPKAATAGLQVIGDSGTPVDWWFIYKISKESQSTTNQKATGQEYLYFDSAMAATAGAKPVLSKNRIDQGGALHDTFSQLFTPAAKANKNLGWYCYNDEDRLDAKGGGTGPSPCGHCKGALAFDLGSNTAFWLIHSVPLLPMTSAFTYPVTGFKEAQTMLCIQLSDVDDAKSIAQLMFDAHGPNVHVASDLLKTAFNKANNFPASVTNILAQLGAADSRVRLMQNTNNSSGSKTQPYAGQVPFVSKGGQKFLAIAKNRAWGDPQFKQTPKDFYDVLVSTALNENIEVETWENAGPKIPPAQEQGETHSVENMNSVNLAPLGIPWSWPEPDDHAKLCISDRSNPPGTDRWVCVGDINFTDSMEKRGGGTVAFICAPLWQALSEVLSAAIEPKPKSAGKSAAPSSGKPAAKPAGPPKAKG